VIASWPRNRSPIETQISLRCQPLASESGVQVPSDQHGVQNRCQPSHDLETTLLGFMAEVALPKHRSRPTAQKSECMKTLFRNSPAVGLGLSFIPTVHQKSGNTHHDYQNRIAEEWIGGQQIDNGLPRKANVLTKQQL